MEIIGVSPGEVSTTTLIWLCKGGSSLNRDSKRDNKDRGNTTSHMQKFLKGLIVTHL